MPKKLEEKLNQTKKQQTSNLLLPVAFEIEYEKRDVVTLGVALDGLNEPGEFASRLHGQIVFGALDEKLPIDTHEYVIVLGLVSAARVRSGPEETIGHGQLVNDTIHVVGLQRREHLAAAFCRLQKVFIDPYFDARQL